MRVIGRISPLSGAVGAGLLPLAALALGACGNPAAEPLLAISPQEPGTEDTLRLQIAEQEGVEYRVSWTRDGEAIEDVDMEVSPDLTNRGETWEVTVTPVDADKDKALDPTVLSVTIGNAAPFGIVTLTPNSPRTGVDLVAQPGFTDPDGDEVTASYSWTRNGTDAGISGNTVTGDKLVKGDVWEVTVVATDGNAEAAPVTASTTVANSAPTAEGARIVPDVVYDDSEVTCEGLGFSDPDGDAEGYKYLWKVDGAVVSSESSLTGEFFDRGQTLSCELIPTDGEDDGPTLFSKQVLVRNGVPTIDSITIDDSEPDRNAPITFTANGVSDADDDEVTLDIWWLVNGRGVSKDESLDPAYFVRGDEIGLSVTPSDGFTTGDTLIADNVTVVNAPPVVVESALNVDPIYTDSVLMPVNEVVDNDGDPITLTYEWQVNGSVVGDETGMLDGTNTEGSGFDKGDTVAYTLTANDGTEDGTPYSSGAITVANKPPEYPDVSLPTPILEDTDIHCALAEEPVDADGDTVTATFLWTLDGSSYAGLTSTTDLSGDTIPAAGTELEETWGCTVELDDGTDTTTTDELEGIVRPGIIWYTAESKSDLANVGSSCTQDGQTGYYSYQYYTAGTTWVVDDVFQTSPHTITIRWRQGVAESTSPERRLEINGTYILQRNFGILTRSTSCDSGRVYEVTITDSDIKGAWNTGGTNNVELALPCCSYYDNGVFYDSEYEYGQVRPWTPDDVD